MRPSDEHIQLATDRERTILESGDSALIRYYLDMINHKKMTERRSDQELWDGCILVTVVYTDRYPEEL